MAKNLGKVGFALKGEWSAVVTYDQLEVVFYEGKVYAAKRSSTNAQPDSSPADWMMWAGSPVITSSAITGGHAITITNADGTSETINVLDGEVTNAVLSETLNELIGNLSNLTTTDKSNVVAAINELDSDVDELQEDIAKDFSTSKAYAVGDYVIYSGDLYRFTSAHTAGAWSSSDVRQVSLGSEVLDLKGATLPYNSYNVIDVLFSAKNSTQAAGAAFAWDGHTCTVTGTLTSDVCANNIVAKNILPYGFSAGGTYNVLYQTSNENIELGFVFYDSSNVASYVYLKENGSISIPSTTVKWTIRLYIRSGKDPAGVVSQIAVLSHNQVDTDKTLSVENEAADAKAVREALKIDTYDDIVNIVKIDNVGTTLGDIATILNSVNTAGDHVFFDISALGVMMYLCTIFVDTVNNQYKVFDLVSGRYAEGTYDATMLLTMATAQANGLAVQSQIDHLQQEIDELGGKSVLANWDVLGEKILDGTSTDIISPGDIVDVNFMKTVLGTTVNGLTVTCSDIGKFADGVGEAEAKDYLFVFDGADWTYNGNAITLSDFGLSVTGTPVTGEVMTIKTTVDSVPYTFVGYDDITPCDSNVPHNWCLEETYAPTTKAYDTYESMFCIQQGKSIAAGKYYLPMYSYRSSDTFNACFTLSAALGSNDSKVQMSRGASGSATITDANGTSKSDIYAVTSMSPVLYGTTTSAGSAVAITYLSDADVTSGGYTLLTSLNVDADDPVVVVGSFDKSALGSNTWELSNIRQYCNDDSQNGSATPTHDNDILSSYNRSAGALYGIDPRVKKLIQYAEIPWLCGRGNVNTSHYVKATGTAPASDAPIYYERGGVPGNRTYTALDPQPSSGDDVSSYYIFENDYVYNTTYVSEDRCFLLSMHEMSFNINATEGNAVDLYAEYTNNTYNNDAVVARAKYNKPGGTLNTYRRSRSGTNTGAIHTRVVDSSGSNSSIFAYSNGNYARAFILGKSTNQ